MSQFIPLSELKKDSRDLSTVLCYQGSWSDKNYKTWEDYLKGTAVLRRKIESTGGDKWLLHCEDGWFFLLAVTALLQCKKEPMITANIAPAYIEEIKGDAPFFTDQVIPGMKNTFHVPTLLSEETGTPDEIPVIDSEEAHAIFYTSGTTGKPKPVRQRIKEFEIDNPFILSKWGEEFYSRKMCCTVSQLHLYGFIFGMLLPFTAGIPFRTEMVRSPAEFEKLTDVEYFIITVPAFLKRAVETETPLGLKSPYILVSGGLLMPDVAEKVNKIFGAWPLEMYATTETSGIGWRQSCNGIDWIPFENAELWLSENNCLCVRSAHIKDPAGFETSDLVKFLPNGHFILMGRLEWLVKIEEKRVSLLEMEGRFEQSGLVTDSCVIPLEDKRQYLAAALVFNAEGKKKFEGLEKNEINKFWREYILQYFENVLVPKKWRYVDALPVDDQGKKKRADIELLFSEEDPA
jgi:acyl-coenzyme A synthetase/AMP-(fatty) acid ligase